MVVDVLSKNVCLLRRFHLFCTVTLAVQALQDSTNPTTNNYEALGTSVNAGVLDWYIS